MTAEVESHLLTKLGFSPSQAKIYLVIAKGGRLTGKEIAKKASMDRAETYRQIIQLQEKGFLKKIIAYPSQFEAIPINELLPILVQKKKQEISTIEKESVEILKKYTFWPEQKKEEFILFIPRNEMITDEIKESLSNAQICIDHISSIKTLKEAGNAVNFWKEPLRRGVKMTTVTEKPSKGNSLPRRVKELTCYPNFVVRCLPSTPNVQLVIEDDKKVWIRTSYATRDKSSWLCSNNPFMIRLGREYFDRILRETEELTTQCKARYSDHSI